MRCPNCGSEISDGLSICPDCDEILDEEFLDGEPAEDSARTPTEPDMPVADRPTNREMQAAPAPAPGPAQPRSRDYEEVNDAFTSFTERLLGLTAYEKLGAVSAFVTFAGSLLPWIDRGRADWLGGTDLGGWLTAVGGLVTIVLILLLPGRKLPLVTSVGVGFVALVLVMSAMSEDGSAALGLLLTLGGGVALGASGVLGLLPER